ncbi:hypothetical protein [Tenacibaculum dicentrarchi]|uniref:Uncharacterized protein n=1 Tax=Tenacibaculum dicentrarchi TaxID=669041 RepID=A0ABM9NQB0_9FLAO|nr:conserved hypothetical protein [Tenacibaculum dicentrarchi]SOS52187.1 conserved hypothetical protein [Tenacibaculum dicentrarchi]
MDLKELLKRTKSKAVFLSKEEKGEAQLIDFYPKENNLGDLQDKMIVFQTLIFNMSNHFFNTFFNTALKQIRLKSDNENILIIKHNGYVLFFLSDKKINTGLLEITLKKEF